MYADQASGLGPELAIMGLWVGNWRKGRYIDIVEEWKREGRPGRDFLPRFSIALLLNLDCSLLTESTIPGRMMTKGRIEYHFKVFGALTILFTEIKLEIGSADELHDTIAQVIAESDGKRASRHLSCISL